MIQDVTNTIIEKNVMVPMRDRVKLATDIYRSTKTTPLPVLLARLPYNKDRPQVLAFSLDRLLDAGYAVVIQDMRGRFASEGEFTLTQDEPHDGVDTIAWIASQPWSNGQVGMFGASYLGIPQWLAAKEQPPALRALAPMHTQHSLYTNQGGAFELGLFLGWAMRQGALGEVPRRMREGFATQDDLDAVTRAVADMQPFYEHLPLTDIPLLKRFAPYYFNWLSGAAEEDARHQRAEKEIYEQVIVPSLNIGGWYDMFVEGALENYQHMKRYGGSESARKFQHLLIGPWAHFDLPGIFTERIYGPLSSTRDIDLVGIHLRWFDHWLKGIDNSVEEEKPVHIFVMGADVWRDEADWPLPDTQYCHYYLHSQGHANTATGDGLLLPTRPEEEQEDVYSYDPHNPVPTIGGANLLQMGAVVNTGPRDQREVERREDVLCYTTPPLAQPVEVTGSISLVLSISSSARDTDFTGKLVDVYPDGRSEIITDGILRMRYRESFTAPALMEEGQVYEIRIHLGSTSNVFKAGHSIRLEVSSSNFPRFNRNTNTGGDMLSETQEELQKSINRVYHNHTRLSYLILPIIERA